MEDLTFTYLLYDIKCVNLILVLLNRKTDLYNLLCVCVDKLRNLHQFSKEEHWSKSSQHNERKSIQTSSVIFACALWVEWHLKNLRNLALWVSVWMYHIIAPFECVWFQTFIPQPRGTGAPLAEYITLSQEELKANKQKAEWGLIAFYVPSVYNISMIIIENSITCSAKNECVFTPSGCDMSWFWRKHPDVVYFFM